MVEGHMYGQMAVNMKEIGMRIGLKVMELILGLMVDNILALGKIICMDTECTPGKMVEDTKATMRWIRSMALVYTSGPMEEDMKEIGLMENSMDRGNTSCPMEKSKLVFGRMGRELSG